jgi:DNA-binding NtrC family response regulator
MLLIIDDGVETKTPMSINSIKILVVDDDAAMREVLEIRLRQWGYHVGLAANGLEAQRLAKSYDPDIVISDVVMPDLSGLDLLSSLKAGNPARPIILITAHASVDMAVEAMKKGAQDFVTKPVDYAKLKAILEAAQRDVELRQESQRLASRLEKGAGFESFVGVSKPMREVYELVKLLGASDASALITGESGTGKELVARTIHELSPRANGPFIAINAAAIPETLMESEIFGHERGAFTGAAAMRPGCFELADKGTLFLDEIAEMPVELQPKLLRVLEDGRVRRLGGKQEFTFDVRVIAATNQDPRQAIQNGRLREDLYYRLNVFTVAMPPLRERKGDIPLLAQHFIGEFNRKHNVNVQALRPETLELLTAYSWPGNVRELKNVIERAVIVARGEWIEPSHLPPYVQDPTVDAGAKIILPVGITAAEAEKELILKTLERVGQNKAEAARQLGLDVKTIRNKLKSYGLDE